MKYTVDNNKIGWNLDNTGFVIRCVLKLVLLCS